MSLIAIGDIHGCARSLDALLDALDPGVNDHLVFIGDYTDRGPRSRQTIDRLIELGRDAHAGRGPRCTFLRGNHDQMMLDWIDHGSAELWFNNGGLTTVESYRNDSGDIDVPDSHVSFLRATRVYLDTDSYCFVHAGLDPTMSVEYNLRSMTAHTFLWTRDHFAVSKRSWEKTVVCGHTPVPEPLISDDLIAIDTGCVFAHHPEFGKLTAIKLPSNEVVQVRNAD
jgi:serine/threonine protein phosphatase 1